MVPDIQIPVCGTGDLRSAGVYRYPSVYPVLGGKVGGVISADIKHWMNESYAYTTVRKVYNIL